MKITLKRPTLWAITVPRYTVVALEYMWMEYHSDNQLRRLAPITTEPLRFRHCCVTLSFYFPPPPCRSSMRSPSVWVHPRGAQLIFGPQEMGWIQWSLSQRSHSTQRPASQRVRGDVREDDGGWESGTERERWGTNCFQQHITWHRVNRVNCLCLAPVCILTAEWQWIRMLSRTKGEEVCGIVWVCNVTWHLVRHTSATYKYLSRVWSTDIECDGWGSEMG